jgi:hypothetical protein
MVRSRVGPSRAVVCCLRGGVRGGLLGTVLAVGYGSSNPGGKAAKDQVINWVGRKIDSYCINTEQFTMMLHHRDRTKE